MAGRGDRTVADGAGNRALGGAFAGMGAIRVAARAALGREVAEGVKEVIEREKVESHEVQH